MDVTKVIVYNRFEDRADYPNHIAVVSKRLSNSVVSLLNQERSTLKTYAIGNAENVAQFEFNVVW